MEGSLRSDRGRIKEPLDPKWVTPSRRPDTNHKGRCAKQVFISIEIWNKPRPDRVTPSRRLEAYTRKVEQEPSIRSRTETDPTRKGDPIAKT